MYYVKIQFVLFTDVQAVAVLGFKNWEGRCGAVAVLEFENWVG